MATDARKETTRQRVPIVIFSNRVQYISHNQIEYERHYPRRICAMVRGQNGKTRTGDAGGVHECVHGHLCGTSVGLYPSTVNY